MSTPSLWACRTAAHDYLEIKIIFILINNSDRYKEVVIESVFNQEQIQNSDVNLAFF